MKKYTFIIFLLFISFSIGCNNSQKNDEIEVLNNKIIEQELLIERLNNRIIEQLTIIDDYNYVILSLNNEIETLKNVNHLIVEDEDDLFIFSIPTTYEEALEIMNRLNIQNVVLEHLTINGEIYTVVKVVERTVEVGTDTETKIYDIPDTSGNIILTLPFKNQIIATMVAIIEEPSRRDWGSGYEHWVKIRFNNDTLGWVRGEYVDTNIGGYKYLTQKNIWLEENFARYLR